MAVAGRAWKGNNVQTMLEVLRGVQRATVGLLLLAVVATGAQAQDRAGVFASYDALRAQMDPLVADLQVAAVARLFTDVPPAEAQNFLAVEIQLQNALPNALNIVERVRVQQFENGFRQELLAYSDGEAGYFFVRLFLHERPDGSVVGLRMNANRVVDPLLGFF